MSKQAWGGILILLGGIVTTYHLVYRANTGREKQRLDSACNFDLAHAKTAAEMEDALAGHGRAIHSITGLHNHGTCKLALTDSLLFLQGGRPDSLRYVP